MRGDTRTDRRPPVLFLSYDGLEDHIAQSQVLPYVLGLAARGWPMTVISHEKRALSDVASGTVARRLRAAGVRWVPQPYHRGGVVSTLPRHLTASCAAAVYEAMSRPRPAIVHARSYLPAATAVFVKRAFGARMLLDMRGFWIDEKIDSGAWSMGALYWAGKMVEPRVFSAADEIVSLTQAGRRVLEQWPSLRERETPISVIPTCVGGSWLDEPRPARDGGIQIGYLGSFGERYLLREMARTVAALAHLAPRTEWRVLSQGDPEVVWRACAEAGLERARVSVESVSHEHVPARLARMNATMSLVKPGFASLGSCPTKFGESLACGTPVVVNDGVGDCADVVRDHHVGVVVSSTTPDHAAAARRIVALIDDPETSRRCRDVARGMFSLEGALDAYETIYERMTRSTLR